MSRVLASPGPQKRERGLSCESQQSLGDCPPTACPRVASSPSLPMFPFRQRRDGFPQPAIRGKNPLVAMSVFSRWSDEIGEPVEERRIFSRVCGSTRVLNTPRHDLRDVRAAASPSPRVASPRCVESWANSGEPSLPRRPDAVRRFATATDTRRRSAAWKHRPAGRAKERKNHPAASYGKDAVAWTAPLPEPPQDAPQEYSQPHRVAQMFRLHADPLRGRLGRSGARGRDRAPGQQPGDLLGLRPEAAGVRPASAATLPVVPPWNIAVFFVYAMRRVDCLECTVTVELSATMNTMFGLPVSAKRLAGVNAIIAAQASTSAKGKLMVVRMVFWCPAFSDASAR